MSTPPTPSTPLPGTPNQTRIPHSFDDQHISEPLKLKLHSYYQDPENAQSQTNERDKIQRRELAESLKEWQASLDIKFAQRTAIKIAVTTIRNNTELGRRGPAGSVLPKSPQSEKIIQEHRRRSLVTPPPTLDDLGLDFVGTWENESTLGLDAYLIALGTGWAQRKVATSFRPTCTWAMVDGVLQVFTKTPIGDRLERFPIGAVVDEKDPYGSPYTVESSWDSRKLVAVSRGPKGCFVTSREVVDGRLIQQTVARDQSGASFTRVFVKAARAG